MSTTETEIYDAMADACDQPAAMLKRLIEHLRAERKPMELFEALKMQTRQRLALPLLPGDNEPSRAEDVEQQLESGLLDACREVGAILVEEGRVGEGWMYLRPTGDVDLARRLVADVPITDENYDEMIQVLLHEGVDLPRGYRAVLDNQGTCNSITLFDQAIATRSKADRKTVAGLLLDHLYLELTTAVRGDISRREAPADDHETLFEMLEKRPHILGEGGYHLDTTHLASVVRIASVLEEPEKLRKAWELTHYGRQLNHQLQYPGDEPFVDFYPAYATFYAILLGENVDAGLTVFERKARSVNVSEVGTAAVETYVDLLDRVGRHGDAVRSAIELVPDIVPSQQMVPLLIEIAARGKSAGDSSGFEALRNYCRAHDDVIGYAAALQAG